MLVTSSTVTLRSVNTVILAVFLPPAPSQDGLPAGVDSVSSPLTWRQVLSP